jgi:putative salt-induced outer membrane protein YdiY
MRPIILVGLSLLVFGFSPIDAAEIRLKDGSLVLGKILLLVDGEDLVVDTEYMDEVTIEWDAIDSIRETQVVEIELFDGRRVFGSFVLDENGLTILGDNPRTFMPKEVFGIDEVSDSFWDALSVYTDLGMNVVRGNNRVTQVSFGGGIGYEARDYETYVDVTTILNEQEATENTRRVTLAATYTHKIRKNWTLSGLYQFESDEQQNLESRSLLGGAVGRRLINSRRHRVDVFGGLAVNAEKFTDLPSEETPEGLFGAAYRLRSRVDVDLSLAVLPNLEQSDRIRSQFDGSVSVDVISDLDLKLTVYSRYDSQPPADNEKSDTGMTLGLSWSY